MQKYIRDPFSMKILQGKFSDGDQVKVNLNGSKDIFVFEKVAA
jgi:ATP-dependent Clp protease ATP-binding subunit ClpA